MPFHVFEFFAVEFLLLFEIVLDCLLLGEVPGGVDLGVADAVIGVPLLCLLLVG